jgi:iron complex outermembrane receptor protein
VAPGSLVRIPALPTLNQQDLSQERVGMTFGAQWRPTDRTTVSFDGVYSQLDQVSTNYQIVPVGLNRNNTQGTANQATYQLSNANIGQHRGPAPRPVRLLHRSAPRPTSSPASTAVSRSTAPRRCRWSGGSGFSFNPNNLEPYDYYNSPTSRGYVNDPTQLAMRNALIGASVDPSDRCGPEPQRPERRLSGARQRRHALGR